MTNHRFVNDASVKRLIELWEDRYVPHWPTPPSKEDFVSVLQLVEVALPKGRAATVAKVQRSLELYSYSRIETSTLSSYIPKIVNWSNVQRLTQSVRQVYEKILEIYQDSSLPAVALLASPVLEMPPIEQLATELEFVIRELREEYTLAQDSCLLGFMTTSFHFCTRFVAKQLTTPELVLLSPYLQFVEEQVSIPWQRVCQAGAGHHPNSPIMTLVQQMIPLCQEIAETVYYRATELYPADRSRRGGLSDSGVMASTIRDLTMFQAYLWLCVLEESMAAIEQELIPLCLVVFPQIGVTWELVKQMLQLLIEEILLRAEPEPMHRLAPYTQAMQQMFSNVKTSTDSATCTN
jgi:hypothetical protein